MEGLIETLGEIVYLSGEFRKALVNAVIANAYGEPLDKKPEELRRSSIDDNPSFFETQDPFPIQLFCMLTIIFLAIHWTYRLFIAIPVSRKVLKYVSGSEPSKQMIGRMTQANCEMTIYSIFAITGLLLLSREAWYRSIFEEFGNSSYMWSEILSNKTLTPALKFFFIAYCARYAQAFISVFLEPRKKDFVEMQVHHISTIILVVLGYITGRVRIGLFIMILMDLADPVLHFGKQIVYIRDECHNKTLNQLLSYITDGIFAIFVLVFTISRMIGFPFAWYSHLTDPVILRKGEFKLEYLMEEHWLLHVANFSLGILMVLQVFWFYFVVKALVKVLSGQDVDDGRSEASADETDDKKHR